MTSAEKLTQILESAQAEFGRAALRRLEGPILTLAGLKPPVASDNPYRYPAGLFVPELKAAAWHDKSFVPDAAPLEAAAPILREELQQLLARREGFQPYDEGNEGFSPYNTKGKWNVFYFMVSGQEAPDLARACPRTTATLAALPNLATSAMFSALTPGTHLAAHCGPFNVVLALSMGLLVPPGSTIRVGTEERTWREGECLVFDDTFEHEVWNRGEGTRFIMLIDVWHPELTLVERKVAARVLFDRNDAEEQVRQHRNALDGQAWWQ